LAAARGRAARLAGRRRTLRPWPGARPARSVRRRGPTAPRGPFATGTPSRFIAFAVRSSKMLSSLSHCWPALADMSPAMLVIFWSLRRGVLRPPSASSSAATCPP
jgi:hypothetical protein